MIMIVIDNRNDGEKMGEKMRNFTEQDSDACLHRNYIHRSAPVAHLS